jgi:hypothetical protein
MIGLIILGNAVFMLTCTISVWATIQNITVDDQYGDQVSIHALPLLFFCYFVKVRCAIYRIYL